MCVNFSSSCGNWHTIFPYKAGKPKKWMVENSWGSASGYRGHLIMTDKWFDEYMFRVVAEKKYVPAKVLDILKQKPIRLPAWDPMFADEE